MRLRLFSVLVLAAIVAAATPVLCTTALADKRVALVIGNSAYKKVQQLNNPMNDAQAVGEIFRAAGFDVIDIRHDLDAQGLRRAIRDFSLVVRDADVAVVFYAGHGIELDGNNYLVPIDAKLAWDVDVEDETVSLDRVLKIIEPAKRLRLVILDACRENPFAASMKRTVATRSIGRGLAKVEPMTSDTLIAFAAKAGSAAEDGRGPHSPFTSALLKHLPVPGLDVRFAFGRVRDEVWKSTGYQQEPSIYGSLGGDTISIVPALPEPPPKRTPPAEIDPRELARALQLELKRVGCFEGAVDGEFGSITQTALRNFAKYAAIAVPENDLSIDAVKAVRHFDKRVCPLVCQSGERAEGERCVRIICPSGEVLKDGTCVGKVASDPKKSAPARPQPAVQPPSNNKCFVFQGRQFCE
jgi:hypothetical protein